MVSVSCPPGRAAPRTRPLGRPLAPAPAEAEPSLRLVENGVRFAQTCILGRLRRETFFSLADANLAIAGALDRINDHVARRLGVTRRHLFETIERRVLAPLPGDEHEVAEWRLARVGVDDHVEHQGSFYSVPHGLIRAQVDVGATSRTIEPFHRGQRVALHQRRYGGRRHGTDPDHMPSSHRRYADGTPDRFRRWAGAVGPNTETLVTAILTHRPHPEQGFRTCLGVLRLLRDLEASRAEAVSARSLRIGALTCQSIASILANRLGRQSATAEPEAVVDHVNLRGPRTCVAPATSIEENHHARPSSAARSIRSHQGAAPKRGRPTLDLLANLGLHGMLEGFQDLEAQPEAKALEHAEWLALLLDREMTLRRQKRLESRARAARLRHQASVEDVDFRAARGLDRGLFLKLAGCDWIRARHGLLLTGPRGRQELAGLRPRPQGPPGGSLRRPPPCPQALCRARPGAR